MRGYRLLVNGNDITIGNYVRLHEDHVDLPFIAIMEALGAKIVWKNETTGK